MAVLHRSTRERQAAESAHRDAQRRAEAEQEKARAEQFERKLIKEIEQEDAQAERLADPPPELSPGEVRERALVARLDRLEGKAQAERQGPVRLNMDLVSRQNQRKDQLRLLRHRLDAERETKRNQEHMKRCARAIKELEQQVVQADEACGAEEARHQQAMTELVANRTRLTEKLGEINRSLEPTESSEQRLKAVMA